MRWFYRRKSFMSWHKQIQIMALRGKQSTAGHGVAIIRSGHVNRANQVTTSVNMKHNYPCGASKLSKGDLNQQKVWEQSCP